MTDFVETVARAMFEQDQQNDRRFANELILGIVGRKAEWADITGPDVVGFFADEWRGQARQAIQTVLSNLPNRTTYCGCCGNPESMYHLTRTWPLELQQLWDEAHAEG